MPSTSSIVGATVRRPIGVQATVGQREQPYLSIGAPRFELGTSCPPDKRANQAAPRPVRRNSSSPPDWRNGLPGSGRTASSAAETMPSDCFEESLKWPLGNQFDALRSGTQTRSPDLYLGLRRQREPIPPSRVSARTVPMVSENWLHAAGRGARYSAIDVGSRPRSRRAHSAHGQRSPPPLRESSPCEAGA